MTVRGMGFATASMYSISSSASTQPPASQILGLLPPIVTSTSAVTPQASPKDCRSVLSSIINKIEMIIIVVITRNFLL